MLLIAYVLVYVRRIIQEYIISLSAIFSNGALKVTIYSILEQHSDDAFLVALLRKTPVSK